METGTITKQAGKTNVEIGCCAPDAHAMYIAGCFNGGEEDRIPMTRDGNGHWHVTLHLPPGRYGYHFVSDGNGSSDSAESVAHEDGRDIFFIFV